MDLKLGWSCHSWSPTVVLGAAGVAALSAVSGAHFLFCRFCRMVQKERRKRPRMKGIVIRSYGGVSSIEFRSDLLIPKIMNQDEVLIKVVAAGLDVMDLMITRGHGISLRSYLRQNNEHVEDDCIILGRECSGIVLDTGSDVSIVGKGDEVWAVSAYCLEGLMAEYVVVKQDRVTLKPRNVTFEEAASLPYTAIQACNALMRQAALNTQSTINKRILVITGNSPLGLFAIQLLKSWGGVVTTAVPTNGLPMSHVLGADDIIVYSVTDFEVEFRKRKGFDIVINGAGTILHPLCVDITRPGGKVVTLTTTPILTDKFQLLCGSVMSILVQTLTWFKKLKRGLLTNFWWDNFSYDRAHLVKTATLVEEGKICPIIEQVYEMEEAGIAFRQLAQHDNVGKKVIRISDPRHIKYKYDTLLLAKPTQNFHRSM